MHLSVNFLLNLLLNSIPEEIYVVCLCLVLQGLTKQIKINYRLIVSILVPATVSNILRYFLNMDMSITFVCFIGIMSLALILMYKQTSIKRILLVIACTTIACVINVLFETIDYGILMTCSPINEDALKSNALLSFISSLPFRTLELGLASLYIKKQRDIDQKIRVNLWQQILMNKESRYFTVISSVFTVAWLAGFLKIFAVDKVLISAKIEPAYSILILMGGILVPIIVYISLFFSIYNARARELYIKSLGRDTLISRLNIAKYYATSRNYEKVETVLNEIIERG